MRKMKAVEVREPKGPLQLVQRDVPSSGTGQVLIKVQACGICHSDLFTKWPGLQYPRVPGHEIAGIIDAAGPGVDEWKPGERVLRRISHTICKIFAQTSFSKAEPRAPSCTRHCLVANISTRFRLASALRGRQSKR